MAVELETPPAITPPVDSAPAPEQTQAPPDPRAEINAFAESVGVDPTALLEFPDVGTARAAVKFWTENTARGGDGGQQYTQPYQQAPAYYNAPGQPQPQYGQPQPASSLATGLDENDPAAKAIRALEAQIAQIKQTNDSAAARFEQMEQTRQRQVYEQLHAEAEEIVSSWQSPKYGAGPNRTMAQRLNQQRVYEIADQIVRNSQGPVPPLAARLARARLIDGDMPTPPPPVQNQQAQTQQALRTTTPGPAPQGPAMRLTDRWADNPEIRAKLGIV